MISDIIINIIHYINICNIYDDEVLNWWCNYYYDLFLCSISTCEWLDPRQKKKRLTMLRNLY